MGEFFGSIYCWLDQFFGIDLANYLWGLSSPDSTTNQFIGIGLWMLGITLGVVVVYYYILDHPKLCNWWGWAIFLGINAAINFIVGWQWVLRDYYAGKMITIDPATQMNVPLPIGESELLCFGVTNMINSIIAFIVISFCIKWWSKNCSSAPF